MTRKEIEQFLRKNLSYDGAGGEVCPKCGYISKEPHYWYYHYTSMSHNLATEMGLGQTVGNLILRIVEEDFASGNVKIDAPRLAKQIYEKIYK